MYTVAGWVTIERYWAQGSGNVRCFHEPPGLSPLTKGSHAILNAVAIQVTRLEMIRQCTIGVSVSLQVQ